MRRGRKRQKAHVSLDPTITEILDAIAARMGEDPLYPIPSRSDLLNKAAALYIARCKERPELREVIETVEAKHSQPMKVVAFPASDAPLRSGVRVRRAGPASTPHPAGGQKG
jgi:hypothetical protein